MPEITLKPNLGDVLKYEAPNLYSRETATVAAGQNLQLGTVLGRQSADKKLYALAPTATDGTEFAAGVLLTDIDATLIDREDAVVLVRHAIVGRKGLIWPVGITSLQKTTCELQLATLGIVVGDSA